MTRRSAKLRLDLDAPPAPASHTRAATGPFRFIWRRPGQDDLLVDVPRRHEDHGAWPNGAPRMVPSSDAALERAMRLHGERVRAGARRPAPEGEPSAPKVTAAIVRALLLAQGKVDCHAAAKLLGVQPQDAAHILSQLRTVGHVGSTGEKRALPGRSAGDRRGDLGPGAVTLWELTPQGKRAAEREAKRGKTKSTFNDSGHWRGRER